MNQSKSTVNWIGTYMEWTNADGWAFESGSPAHSGIEEANAEAMEEFAASYLDWMESR